MTLSFTLDNKEFEVDYDGNVKKDEKTEIEYDENGAELLKKI